MLKTNAYPLFEENQVLSYQHLNQLTAYLESEDRATRAALLGCGILCGLQAGRKGNYITLSRGTGVTSNGHLVTLNEDFEFRFAATFDDKQKYARFVGEDRAFKLWQLFEDAPPARFEAVPLDEQDATFFANKALVLYLEMEDRDLDVCINNHCVNQGREQRFNLRALLLEKADLRTLEAPCWELPAPVSEAALKAVRHAPHEIFEPVLGRFICNPAQVENHTQIVRQYLTLVDSAGTNLVGAMSQAVTAYHRDLTKNADSKAVQNLKNILGQIRSAVESQSYLGLQYVYDLLRDLTQGMHEFLDLGLACRGHCGCHLDCFPQHLMVGDPNYKDCRPDIYRHDWNPSLAANGGDCLGFRFRLWWDRLHALPKTFLPKSILNPDLPVRVTPSLAYTHPLAEQALPYYYDYRGAGSAWNDEAAKRCQFDRLPGYRAVDLSNAPALKEPLKFGLQEKDFFRIEGHVGKPIEAVRKDLEDQVDRYNLPFKVEFVRLGPAEDRQHACSLEDLHTLYSLLREEALCLVQGKIDFFTGLGQETGTEKGGALEGVTADRAGVTRYDFTRYTPYSSSVVAKAKKTEVEKAKAAAEEEVAFDEAAEAAATTKALKYLRASNAGTGAIAFVEPAERFDYVGLLGGSQVIENRAIVSDTLEVAYAKIPEVIYPFLSILNLVDALIQEITGRLTELPALLPEEPAGVDAEAFGNAFEAIRAKSQSLVSALEKVIVGEERVVTGRERAIINEAHQLATYCGPARLSRWQAIYAQRQRTLTEAGTLASFAKQHPGLEHLAGVAKGGTFVVVYADAEHRKVDLSKTPKKPGLIRPIAPLPPLSKLRADLSSLLMPRSFTTLNAGTATVLKRNFSFGPAAASPAFASPAVDSLEKLTGPGALKLFEDFLSRLEKERASADEDIVIADFSLPYLCCGECSSVSYIVVPEVTLRLPKDRFCHNDPTAYAFEVSPPGGDLTGPAGLTQEGDTWFYTPDAGVPGAQTFVYRFGGRTASFTVENVQPPEVRLSSEVLSTEVEKATVRFTAEADGIERFNWDFGDGQTVSRDDATSIEHTYDLRESRSFTISLVALAGPCEIAAETKIEFALEPITLELEPDEFCVKDKTEFTLEVAPKGGDLVGEGTRTEDDDFFFSPSRVNLGTAEKRDLTIKYTAPDGRTRSIVVTVFSPPTVDIDPAGPEIVEEGAMMFFHGSIGGSADRIDWDFGDGLPPSDENKKLKTSHTYRQPGEFEVRLTARRGPCVGSRTVTIKIPETRRREGPRREEFAEFAELGSRAKKLREARATTAIVRDRNLKTPKVLETYLAKAHAASGTPAKFNEFLAAGGERELIKLSNAVDREIGGLLTSETIRLSRPERTLLSNYLGMTTATVAASLALRENDLRNRSALANSTDKLIVTIDKAVKAGAPARSFTDIPTIERVVMTRGETGKPALETRLKKLETTLRG